MASSRRFNDTFSALPTTVFEEMSLLAAKHNSTNLGQGFPDNVGGSQSLRINGPDYSCGSFDSRHASLHKQQQGAFCSPCFVAAGAGADAAAGAALPGPKPSFDALPGLQELEGPEGMKKAATAAMYDHSNQCERPDGLPLGKHAAWRPRGSPLLQSQLAKTLGSTATLLTATFTHQWCVVALPPASCQEPCYDPVRCVALQTRPWWAFRSCARRWRRTASGRRASRWTGRARRW